MKTASSNLPLVWGVLAGLLTAAITVSFGFTLRSLYLIQKSSHWPAVQGRVIAFTHVEPRPRSGYPESDLIRYGYRINGQDYVGSTVSFSRRTKWYQNDVRALIERYGGKSAVMVFYDQSNPANSVLEPGGPVFPTYTMLLLQFGLLTVTAWLSLTFLVGSCSKFKLK